MRVTVLDRTNHHLFQPLLYQVAVAGLSLAEIAQPVRSILRGQENVTVPLVEVAAVISYFTYGRARLITPRAWEPHSGS